MPRRPAGRLLGLTVLAIGLAITVLIAACASGDDGAGEVADRRAAQARQAALDAGLGDDVADFLALAARGETATYRVAYPGAGEGQVLRILNRPPDRRVEISADGQVTEVRLVVDGESFRCTPGSGIDGGRCERTDAFVEPLGLFADDAVHELRNALAERRADFSFALEAMPVAGVEATCLVTSIRAGQERPDLGDGGTICLAPDGALLLVDQGGDRLEALEYSTDLGADDPFELPDRP